ncbi:hypothetical protein GCM10022409_48050 [Hymenobacter glaciei]|uniref:chitinase n=1 Tax=Hymenobacter glaciei TaxID=877209 RepID=A0ABP7UXS7_9BACT
MLLPPPSVQDYRRYSAEDRQTFSIPEQTARPDYQYPAFLMPPLPDTLRLRPGAVVFGWHPFWMGTAYVNYDFALLTHVAYYGYQATDQGELQLPAPAGQGPEKLITQARQQNPACQVLLTISYPGAEGRTSLLTPGGAARQQRLVEAIVQEVAATHADGVNLDFSPPDQKPTRLNLIGQQKKAEAAALQKKTKQSAARKKALLKQQQAQVPLPADALALATAKDEYTDSLRQTTEQLQEVNRRIVAHKAALPHRPAPPPTQYSLWQRALIKLKLQTPTPAAPAAFDTTQYHQAGQALAAAQKGLLVRSKKLRQQLAANAGQLRQADAAQTAGQPVVAANVAEIARTISRSQDSQAVVQQQLAATGEALRVLQRRKQTYRYVVPASMLPLANRSQELQNFLRLLSARLKAGPHKSLIALSMPAVDSTRTYANLQHVQDVVQLFILKAFDYTPYNQVVPGPLAPLNPGDPWGPYSVTTSVAYYLQFGHVPRPQLVVGFPHLAKYWQVDSVGNELVGDEHAPEYWTNRQLRSHLPLGDTKLDLTSLSRNTSSLARTYGLDPPQAWWEDSASLAPKYAWVKKEQLAGVGIWALGYDDGSRQTWHLLQASFTTTKPPEPPRSLLEDLYSLRHVLLFAGVVLIGFMLLGLLIAFFRNAHALAARPPVLAVVGLLIGLCLVALAGYLVWFGGLPLAEVLLAGLGMATPILLVVLYRRIAQHRIIP